MKYVDLISKMLDMTTLLQIVLNEVRGRVWGLMWLAVLFRDRHSHDTGHSVDYLVATE